MLTAGTLRRGDIMAVFGVSMPQASADISRFLCLYPSAIEYDRRAKYYRSADGYQSQRNLNPDVLQAIEAMAATGHPMGWSQPSAGTLPLVIAAIGRR